MEIATESAERLRGLATDPRFSERSDDLNSLADELVDHDLDSWVGMDLIAAFPPESAITVQSPRLPRSLAALVAASVFAPVGWTWYSLHQASQAYLALVRASHHPIKDSFLTLWISGFGGHLSPIHRLVPVTLVSVLLIGLATLLVVVHRIVASSADVAQEEQWTRAAALLVRELTTAQRVLNARRSDDPSRIEALVRHSVKQLLSAHEATQKSAEGLREAASSVGVALGTLSGAAAENHAAARVTSEASNQLAQASEATAQSTGDAIKQFVAAIDAHQADLRDAAASALTRSDTVARESAQLVADGVSRVDAAQREVAAHVSALLDAGRQAAETVSASAADLQRNLRDLDAALGRHDSAMQGQASELTAVRDALERMLRQLGAIGNTKGGTRAP